MKRRVASRSDDSSRREDWTDSAWVGLAGGCVWDVRWMVDANGIDVWMYVCPKMEVLK